MTREDYRKVKNMSRAELEEYLRRVYMNGYEAGMKKIADIKAAPEAPAVDEAEV